MTDAQEEREQRPDEDPWAPPERSATRDALLRGEDEDRGARDAQAARRRARPPAGADHPAPAGPPWPGAGAAGPYGPPHPAPGLPGPATGAPAGPGAVPPGGTGPVFTGSGVQNGLGLTAMITGIFSLFAVCVQGLGIPLAMLAIGMGIMGRRRVARGEADNESQALVGIVTGTIGLVLGLAVVALLFWVFTRGPDGSFNPLDILPGF
ncbi:DUF4190 domain-containing protein [Streptomyces tsukubensis]|uniref:DUF4190 domain-containing protein n=1 Tax=Streptomyces tsukubensis TaxID=83656 RepID=UPI00344E6784